jgi:hypothetical protein
MVLALRCTSNPANRTEEAFRAELSTNGSERLELARVWRAMRVRLQNGTDTLVIYWSA